MPQPSKCWDHRCVSSPESLIYRQAAPSHLPSYRSLKYKRTRTWCCLGVPQGKGNARSTLDMKEGAGFCLLWEILVKKRGVDHCLEWSSSQELDIWVQRQKQHPWLSGWNSIQPHCADAPFCWRLCPLDGDCCYRQQSLSRGKLPGNGGHRRALLSARDSIAQLLLTAMWTHGLQLLDVYKGFLMLEVEPRTSCAWQMIHVCAAALL